MKNDDWLLSCFFLFEGTGSTHVLSLKYIQAKTFSGTIEALNDLGPDSQNFHIAHSTFERHAELSLESNRFLANHTKVMLLTFCRFVDLGMYWLSATNRHDRNTFD